MSTRELANRLGIIERITVDSKLNKNVVQHFTYFLVLDFESTCWENNERRAAPEVIEFSVVLYETKTTSIVAEFQQYVTPVEYPKLSEFCKNLTGITQAQVDKGVPIGTCLMLFNKWIQENTSTYKLSFDGKPIGRNHCAFITWSDWDLGTCLKNECKRKHLAKSDIFNKWIDLRALFKEFYNCRPNGLNGALNELGLQFSGQQHCGLHDARNTAYLAGRMIADGVLLKITKELTK